MKIKLIDVDGKIPNLALMKISTFHKARGDNVELMKLNYIGYPGHKKNTLITDYDKAYVSTLYTWNKDVLSFENPNVVQGGTGFDLAVELPQEIEKSPLDYSLYNSTTAYGFITRGCVRKCSFCFVPEKEGHIHKVADISDVFDPEQHKKLVLMDNNILGYDKHEEVLQELIDRNIRIHFNSGLDIRLVTERNLELLTQLRYFGNYLFSFDIPKQAGIITKKTALVHKYIKRPWDLKMCLLIGYDSSLGQDVGRVKWCKERQILPYIMRHEKCWESKYQDFYTDLAAWVNQPSHFKKTTFKQFIRVRQPVNIVRRVNSLMLYEAAEAAGF